MEELFVRPRALMRMREGPLGVCIDTFIDSLAAKGAASNLKCNTLPPR